MCPRACSEIGERPPCALQSPGRALRWHRMHTASRSARGGSTRPRRVIAPSGRALSPRGQTCSTSPDQQKDSPLKLLQLPPAGLDTRPPQESCERALNIRITGANNSLARDQQDIPTGLYSSVARDGPKPALDTIALDRIADTPPAGRKAETAYREPIIPLPITRPDRQYQQLVCPAASTAADRTKIGRALKAVIAAQGLGSVEETPAETARRLAFCGP